MIRCLVIRIVVTAIVLKQRRRCTLRQYDIHIIECTAEEQTDSAVILNKCDSQLLFYPVLVAPDEKTGSFGEGAILSNFLISHSKFVIVARLL